MEARPGRAIPKTCKMVPWLPLYTLLNTTLLDDKNWDMSVRMVTIDHPDLTHISLASFLWDIGKEYSPKWDAAERGVPSVAILFA